jgi:hypothetical protein
MITYFNNNFLEKHISFDEKGKISSSSEVDKSSPPIDFIDLSNQEITDEMFFSVARKLVKKRTEVFFSINLAGAKITDKGLTYLGGLRIVHLDLSRCSQITDDGLYLFNPTWMTHLSLSVCTRVTRTGLIHFYKSPLQYLDLRGCIRLDNNDMVLLKSMPLTYLDVSACPKINREGLQNLQGLPLRSLKLGCRSSLTDADLRPLRVMNTLTTLDLQRCPQITDDGIKQLDRVPIEVINLEKCPGIKLKPGRVTWEEYLKRNTDKIIGDPEKAEIFFLGDVHTDKSLTCFWIGVVDHSARDGDVLVVEGAESMKDASELEKFSTKKKLHVYGWDDLQALRRSIELDDQILELSKTANAMQQKIIDLCNQGQKSNNLTQAKEISEKIKAFKALLQTNTEMFNKIEKENEQLMDVRNASLLKTVLKLRESGKRVFVIGGTHHFLYDKRNYCITDALKEIPCTILMPSKDTSVIGRSLTAAYSQRLIQRTKIVKEYKALAEELKKTLAEIEKQKQMGLNPKELIKQASLLGKKMDEQEKILLKIEKEESV